MQQAEYNAKVQDMQRFCEATNLQHRVRPSYIGEQSPRLIAAYFEVFYGDWRTVGSQQHPMKPEATFDYSDEEDMAIRAEVARDLSR